MIYIVVNINTDLSGDQIPHTIGWVLGLLIRITGLVATIRHKVILLLLYATAMGLITAYTPLNYQFIVNLLTTITSIVFVIAIRVKSYRNSSVDNRTPDVIIVEENSLNNTPDLQLSTASPIHRSPSPSAPPPYRGPAPPPPYSEFVKYWMLTWLINCILIENKLNYLEN